MPGTQASPGGAGRPGRRRTPALSAQGQVPADPGLRARTAHHHAGDAYLLRSDTTAHRVTPLARPGLRRTVLNFASTTPAARPHRTSSATELHE
ncbi:HalD/BesD family halogenase [Streptomyces hydrogenans]|uniref:HalD/BesD family halogenase n=1 Tax=Streptomyces hydrogenans TaxID=1873719 RepID=UPI003F53E699